MIARLVIGSVVTLAVIVLTLVIIRVRDNRKVAAIWRSLEAKPLNEVFTEQMVANLPAPARRYLLHAIRPGALLSATVTLKMRGALRLKPEAEWQPMTASEILSVPAGFVWQATVGTGLVQFSGADYYANGAGRVRFCLWGLIPLASQGGPDITRSSLGRCLSESFWQPSSLLPQRGVQWKAVDDESAEAELRVGEETIRITFWVAPNGRLRKVKLLRWGKQTTNSSFGYAAFGGEFKAERRFGGYTIPSQVSGGWWLDSERYFEFFRAEIEDATFK